MESRINNPIKIARQDVENILSQGPHATIQFSEPTYNRKTLKLINKLCKIFDDKLEVRFYGHHSTTFDCSVLRYLPDVKWLALDCLTKIDQIEALSELDKITRFNFGVYRFDSPNLLAHLNLSQLISLSLGENDKKNLNLEFLSKCVSLESLSLSGHLKNIESISTLENIRSLSLRSISKKQSLGFLNSVKSLRELTIILGGRENLNDFSHSSLTSLNIIRVRGFEETGDLTRFPRLESLRIEDQIKLKEISLLGSNNIQEVSILNCKNCKTINGLLKLPELKKFRASRTNLDLDYYLEADWPPSMNVVALNSGSSKWNKMAKLKLEEKGYQSS